MLDAPFIRSEFHTFIGSFMYYFINTTPLMITTIRVTFATVAVAVAAATADQPWWYFGVAVSLCTCAGHSFWGRAG